MPFDASHWKGPEKPVRWSWAPQQAALAASAALAAVALGFLLFRSPPGAMEPSLARMLFGMAAIKFLIFTVPLTALISWRLSGPASLNWRAAYLGALSLSGFGLGLIWALVHPALSAFTFHAGNIVMIGMLLNDETIALRLKAMLEERSARRHSSNAE